jgi:riboflavin kinase
MSVQETMTPVNQDVVHQPDYQFASWCLRQYGVNKGIYNTIDERLFNLGLKDIVTRRMTIISFLDQVHQSNPHHDNGKKN